MKQPPCGRIELGRQIHGVHRPELISFDKPSPRQRIDVSRKRKHAPRLQFLVNAALLHFNDTHHTATERGGDQPEDGEVVVADLLLPSSEP